MKGLVDMLNTRTVVNQLLGKGIVEALVALMSENFPDFSEFQKQYLETMHVLQTELGDTAESLVQEEMGAIEKQIASQFLFSAYLGIKANFDNFMNPVARSFLGVDFEGYLREKAARRLPEYKEAQDTRKRFYADSVQTARYTEVVFGLAAYTIKTLIYPEITVTFLRLMT